MIQIYVLKDPITHEVKYVGKTNDQKKRYNQHTCLSRQRKLKVPLSAWLVVLLQQGLKPVIQIIENVAGDWEEREKFWIQFYKDQGCNLCNVSEGGGKGMTGKKYDECKNSKRVYGFTEDLTLEKSFASTTEANDKEGYSFVRISQSIKEGKPYKGLYWSYSEDPSSVRKTEHRSTKFKNIIQYFLEGEKIAEFENMKELRKQTGYKLCNIYAVLYGRRPHAFGYCWKQNNEA